MERMAWGMQATKGFESDLRKSSRRGGKASVPQPGTGCGPLLASFEHAVLWVPAGILGQDLLHGP